MEQFTISILGAKVTYISSVPLLNYFIKNKEYMEFYDAKIVSKVKRLTDDDYVIVYYNIKDKSCPIIINGNKMIINYPFEELNESIILYLASHFLEKQFGQMGICSCHSACVTKDGNATLILGDAGAGKTSLAYKLCQSRGYKLISNDMTLIGMSSDKIIAFAGTKFINLRLLSVKQNMPELLPLFNNDNIDGWINKISVIARDIGIEEEYNPTIIENIIYLRIDNREKLIISNGDSWRNNFLLYQNTSSHIRGSAATFINKKGYPIGYIPPMETQETYKKRVELLNEINKNKNYKYVVGPLEDIIEYIDSLYKLQNGKVKKYEKK